MTGYYADNLSADRLRRCYELAPPRVRRYLRAELDHVMQRLPAGARVLELGCGYGRVLRRLAGRAETLVGIDLSVDSLRLALSELDNAEGCSLLQMEAATLGFAAGSFDLVVCIQNGIAVFDADPGRLLSEALRVTRPGGRVLFSSYAAAFWEHRLEWFRIQADHGLLGALDDEATGDGVIVCRDGFRSTTMGPEDFSRLAAITGCPFSLCEVDGSSLFCELAPPVQQQA